MRRPGLVLFDLDGTLTDPYDGITRCIVHALQSLDWPVPAETELRGFIGPPLHDSFASRGMSPHQVDLAVNAYRERFTDVGMFENRVYDGIPAALEHLDALGVRMAVATSKPTVYAERILEHFDLARFFVLVSGATLDGSRRHKADILRFALAGVGGPLDSAVMIGDRAQDVLGAAAVGLSAIGVAWGYAEPGELEAAGAWRIVEQPQEVVELVAAGTPPVVAGRAP